ncbi:helicase associated domain-containing protein [Streptomyces anulatus]|uniref:helicase associated domain-containing protein n=1 Tax=Streptomyces anulatus TaxID=1892 RepID=UPI0039A6E9E3
MPGPVQEHPCRFPLGQWLNAQRSLGRRQDEAGPHLQVLDEIDVWWNPPWPRRGSGPGTGSALMSETGARRLQEGTGRTAVTAGPRGCPYSASATSSCGRHSSICWRRSASPPKPPPFAPTKVIAQLCGTAPGLDHARTYAAQHGHLAIPQSAYCEGFPLGRWLSEQRRKAREHHRGTGGRWPVSTLLAALDPWWSPTWSVATQLESRTEEVRVRVCSQRRR